MLHDPCTLPRWREEHKKLRTNAGMNWFGRNDQARQRAGSYSAALPITDGVVFKRRASSYTKQRRASAETRDWLKRRFAWD